jgi:hypothetical protein
MKKTIVNLELPCEAYHKLFKKCFIVGVRTECESNNNIMYMIKLNKKEAEYFWVYDYETKII